MLSAPTPIPDSPERLIFGCSGCGLTLSADPRHVGVSGPCPSCGTQVSAPGVPQTVSSSAKIPELDLPQIYPNKASSSHRRGGIVADSALDHHHSDRRETAKSLWIFALFILVVGACLVVTWFLKDWVSK